MESDLTSRVDALSRQVEALQTKTPRLAGESVPVPSSRVTLRSSAVTLLNASTSAFSYTQIACREMDTNARYAIVRIVYGGEINATLKVASVKPSSQSSDIRVLAQIKTDADAAPDNCHGSAQFIIPVGKEAGSHSFYLEIQGGFSDGFSMYLDGWIS